MGIIVWCFTDILKYTSAPFDRRVSAEAAIFFFAKKSPCGLAGLTKGSASSQLMANQLSQFPSSSF